MRVYVSRDSVAAGDDLTPPHSKKFTVADGSQTQEVIAAVIKAYRLPTISGGKATWCLSSSVPLAVVAQQWRLHKIVDAVPPLIDKLDLRIGTVCFHFSYLLQIDPDVVMSVLQNLTLRAIDDGRGPSDQPA